MPVTKRSNNQVDKTITMGVSALMSSKKRHPKRPSHDAGSRRCQSHIPNQSSIINAQTSRDGCRASSQHGGSSDPNAKVRQQQRQEKRQVHPSPWLRQTHNPPLHLAPSQQRPPSPFPSSSAKPTPRSPPRCRAHHIHSSPASPSPSPHTAPRLSQVRR